MTEVEMRLSLLRDYFAWWLEWNAMSRNTENLPTDDHTHIICVPPHWPSRGALKHWIETLDMGIRDAKLRNSPSVSVSETNPNRG